MVGQGDSISSIVGIGAIILLLSPLMVYYLKRWQWALLGYVIYLPVSGYVAILLNKHPVALQAKEFFFLVPAYIGFALFLQSRIQFSGVPRGFTLAAVSLLFLCAIQMINPTVYAPNPLVGLVGIKVWTFYLPLIMISYIYISDPRNLIIMLRAIVVSAWVPAGIGIVQYVLSVQYGFEKIMKHFYGDAARAVTFQFGEFNTSGGTLFRLPSTFTFVTQYSFFLLAALCFVLIAIQLERNRWWKLLNYLTLPLIIAAALTCGARYQLYLVPTVLMMYFVLQRGVFAGVLVCMVLAVFNVVLVVALKFNPLAQALYFSDLLVDYVFVFFPKTTMAAVINHPLGMGVGTATNQVRHIERYIDMPIKLVEGYLGKAGYELGIPGIVICASLLLIPIFVNVKNLFRSKDLNLRGISAGLLVYQFAIAAKSLKANPLDQDPSNFFFWLSVGFTFRLNAYFNAIHNQPTAVPRIEISTPPVMRRPQSPPPTQTVEEELSG